MRRFLPICLIGTLLCGCSPNWVLRQDAQTEKLHESVLGVLPFTEKTNISYQGDVRDEFGEGDKDSLILSYVQKTLCDHVRRKSRFGHVLSGSPTSEVEYGYRELDFNGKAKLFAVPMNKVDFTDGSPDIVLAVSELKIVSVTTVQMVYFVPVGYTRSLDIKLKFVYWNQKLQQEVAIGEASDNEGAGLAITIDDWDSILEIISNEVLLDGKFAKEM